MLFVTSQPHKIKKLELLAPPPDRPLGRREGLEIEFNHVVNNFVNYVYVMRAYIKPLKQ